MKRSMISLNTMAVIPAPPESPYRSKIIERGGKVYVSEHSQHRLINEACKVVGSSLGARRQFVRTHFRMKKLIPVPVWPMLNMYAVPTTYYRDADNMWLLLQHIVEIKRPLDSGKAIVTFADKQELEVNLGARSLKQLVMKAHVIKSYYDSFGMLIHDFMSDEDNND